MKATHLPAQIFIKGTGINKNTFYQRVHLRNIEYIEPFNGDRLYSIDDWNKKCSDYELDLTSINE